MAARPTINVTISLSDVESGTAEAFRTAINNNSDLIVTAVNQIVSQVNSGMVNTILSVTQPTGQQVGDFWFQEVTS